MTKIQIFGIVAGIASILSLIISVFIAKKVVNINTEITLKDDSETKVKQSVKGDSNIQVGRDSNVR